MGKAHCILAGIRGKLGWARQESEGARAPVDNAGRRQFAFAQEKEVHDERLWMGITRATGALGNTSCLVGTAEQVAASILGYYRLGVSSFPEVGLKVAAIRQNAGKLAKTSRSGAM